MSEGMTDARPTKAELDAVAAYEKQFARERRERIATAALQGMLAADASHTVGYSEAAEWAVGHADALITELDQ